MGFFTGSELSKKSKKKIDVNQLEPFCGKCGLSKKCIHPKIKYTGEGKKKLLIISEFIAQEEDEFGIHLVGEQGEVLKKELRKIGISLHKDCWKIAAVNCNTPRNRVPTHKEIKCCYPMVQQTILKLKPTAIILLGNIAVTSLFGDDFSNRTILRWRAHQIPDEKFKCFILPLFAPYQLIKQAKDKNLQSTFRRDLKRVNVCLKKSFEEPVNYEQYVTILQDFKRVKTLLKRILKRKQTISFDYETTGLKPHRNGHKIVSIGVSVSPTRAYAFPFDFKSFWTKKELHEIKELWHKIIADKDIKKICHNYKYEDNWSEIKIGSRIQNIHWDTMICQKIIDNRGASTGLKFQSFIRYGVRPYDKSIAPYLKSKVEFNTVEQAPLKDLLIYNGLDCIFTHMLYKDQKSYLEKMKELYSAYRFFLRGIQTMSTIQLNGIDVDTEYYEKAGNELTERINKAKKYLTEGREARKFNEQFKRDIKITSNQDLGKLFFEVLGKNPVYTEAGNYKTDSKTLESLNLPFVDKLSSMKRLEKARGTYLAQFEREVYKGKIHPFFDLHIPVSYRSCIAGYEKVLVMRDFESEGIPIKDVKVGDYVYCFDNNLNPQIKKVLWQGKTGHREIIRVHYYRKGKKGHFDCTPEHKVRLINGEYVEAKNLLKKQHYKKETAKEGNCRVLACSRHYDRLNFTNHLTSGTGICEHRLIYEQFIGPLTNKDVIHHKDKNHLNHESQNLKKMCSVSHAKLHCKDTLCSKQSRINNIIAVKKGWKEGRYKNSIKRGKDAPNYLGLSKGQCICMLMDCAGMIKITADKYNIDFTTFKKYLNKHKIDWNKIRLCFDKHGKYISKERLSKLSKIGRSKVKDILGHNHYKLLRLYDYYGIDTKRNWGNQHGKFKPGNHTITKVEKLHKKEDVYDIEVEDCHNFFVNEICVHNSSSKPNFQNIPKRNAEIKKLIRMGIVPSKDSVICEMDFSGSEVITSAAYHKDPTFIHDITVGDMHRDLAIELFMLDPESMNKNNFTDKEILKRIKEIRFYSKNNWTFAQFYGDWFGSCAPNLWENVVEAGLRIPDGSMTVKEHLESKGIFELGEMINYEPTPGSFLEHCKEVEQRMWNERFPKYTQWKKDVVEFYQTYGFIETFFGFRFTGYMDNKQCTNFPIQSVSFHLLLFTLIKTEQFLKKNKFKAKIIGQVHDSVILNIPKNEIIAVTTGIVKIVHSLKDRFKWLIVPMDMEIEMSRTRECGGNFSQMKEFLLSEIQNNKHEKYIMNIEGDKT